MSPYYDAVPSDDFIFPRGWACHEPSSPQSNTGYRHSQDPFENQSRSNVGLEAIQSYSHSVDDSAPGSQLDVGYEYSPESEEADQPEPSLDLTHPTERCSFSDPGVHDEFKNRLHGADQRHNQPTDQHPNSRFVGQNEQNFSAQRHGIIANSPQRPPAVPEAIQAGPLEGIGSGLPLPPSLRPERPMINQQGQSIIWSQNNDSYGACLSRQQLDQNSDYSLPNIHKRTRSTHLQQQSGSCQLDTSVDSDENIRKNWRGNGIAENIAQSYLCPSQTWLGGRESSFKDPWSPEVMGGGNGLTNVPVAINTHRRSIMASNDSVSRRNSSHGISSLPTNRDGATPMSSLNPPSIDIGASDGTQRPVSGTRDGANLEMYQIARWTETSSTMYDERDTLNASQIHEHHPMSEAWAERRESNHLPFNDGTQAMSSMYNIQHLGVPQCGTPRPSSASPVSSIVSNTPPREPEIVLRCPVCSSFFNGQYRKGNLARHRRLKHGKKEKIYPCESPNCIKCFKRKDARLKHCRTHHPELSPPVFRPRNQT